MLDFNIIEGSPILRVFVTAGQCSGEQTGIVHTIAIASLIREWKHAKDGEQLHLVILAEYGADEDVLRELRKLAYHNQVRMVEGIHRDVYQATKVGSYYDVTDNCHDWEYALECLRIALKETWA